MRVLQIEDDPEAAEFLESLIRKANFHVHTTSEGEEGINLAKRYRYDVILLNMGLPDMTGIQALLRLRAAKVATPVMIVSTVNVVAMKVRALDAGADDYLTKPYHPAELIVRIHALVRRAAGHAHSLITLGNTSLDLGDHVARVSNVIVPFAPKEYSTFELLMSHPDTPLSKETFIDHLYGSKYGAGSSNLVNVFMVRIRHKLGALCSDACIETVRGMGYRLNSSA